MNTKSTATNHAQLSWEHFHTIQEKLVQTIESDLGCPLSSLEPAAEHLSFKTGGLIGGLVFPRTKKEIILLLELCRSEAIPWLILGKGSNTLIRDGGFPGLILKISDNFTKISMSAHRVTVLAGVSMHDIAYTIAHKGLAGLEFSADIPGTIGGGLYMNAGMHDETLSQKLSSVEVLDCHTGQIVTRTRPECKFGYRSSIFQKKPEIILQATFELVPEEPRLLIQKIEKITQERKRKYPLEYPNAGSIFKRPPGEYAGALIEQAGLKGKTVGGAMISPKHANFIVNVDQASATDIENLIDEIRTIIFQKFSVQLQPEIHILGLPGK